MGYKEISSVTLGKRILFVDDDENLGQMLMEQLEIHEEFILEEARTGSAAIQITKDQYFDAILLDVSLPDTDGREVCRAMRRNGMKSPIIMISDVDTDVDTILSLDSGANDYVTKPFKIGVLMARLRAHIRQHEQSEYVVLRLGPYTFRPGAKLLMDNETNRKVRLTDKEAAIIKFLHLCNGRVVSRDVLLGEIWGYSADLTTHTLETHVYRLRQKIERDPSKAKLLVTEHNGYRLVV